MTSVNMSTITKKSHSRSGCPGALDESQLPPLPENFQYDQDETVLHRVCRREDDALIHWPILRVVRDWSEFQWRYLIWNHHRFVEKVDCEIGMVLTALEQSRFRDNTVIIFSVDHGEAYGQHQMFQKFTLYEESIRVPFIVATLGDKLPIPKAVFNETHFVSGVDLMPTVCDHAGIERPEDIQGLSVRPLVEDHTEEKPAFWREFAFVESNYWGRALIFDRYKYVCEYIPFGTDEDLVPPGPDAKRIGREQIFDLVADPQETRNLAYKSELSDQIHSFRQALFDFESQLYRRPIVEERPIQQIRRWGSRIKDYWNAHPELYTV